MTTDNTWMTDALCAQVAGDAWCPADHQACRTAQRICQDCPVLAACRDYALTCGMGTRVGLSPTRGADIARNYRVRKHAETEVAA